MKWNQKVLLVLALILLTGGWRGLAAQEPEPVPIDEELMEEEELAADPEIDQELPLDEELPEEPPADEEMPAFDEMPADSSLPEELDALPLPVAPPAASPQPKPKAPSRPAAPRPPQAASFQVRAALAGSGFRGGASGTLRISTGGVSFTRQGQKVEDWRIQWTDLAEAKGADGIWDAPHPLVIQERGGRKHYVALIDAKGRYLPGQPVLSAITKGQRKGG